MTKRVGIFGVGIFGVIILLSAICAIKVSQHSLGWILALTASIPIYAAVVGAFLKNKK